MPYRNDRQRSKTCKTLLEMGHLERLWQGTDLGPAGPTEEAVFELERVLHEETLLSRGEGVLLRVVFDFWNGGGKVSLWEMMENLDRGVFLAIGELMVALGDDDPAEVDAWVTKWQGYDPAKEFFAD
jgi:hypothetical protein